MGLTQISTGGVKDDAITAGKIPANSIGSSEISDDAIGQNQLADNSVVLANLTNDCVDGSKIADEAIAESRLEISNAGTNGQFLQKQSGNTGGLTWADAITAIADDSITQAKIADDAIGQDQLAQNAVVADNLTADCVTSVKIADGAVTEYRIGDNEVTEPKLKISNTGTNGQYLQKQSGNTGGLTWADVSSAPTIEATANGSISANEAVIVESDGKVAGITAQANATSTSQNGPQMDQNYGPRYIQTAWDSANETIFAFWYEHTGNSGQSLLYCAAGTLSGASTTSVTWGSKVEVYDGTARWPQVAFLSSGKFLLTWAQDSGAGKGQIATVNGTTVTLQGSPQDDGVSNKHNDSDLIALTSTKAVLVYAHGSTDDNYIKVITISGNSISFGSATICASSHTNGGYNRLIKLSDTKCLWTYFRSPFQTVYGRVCTVGSSDTTATLGSDAVFIDNKGTGNHVALYDPVKEQGAFIFEYSSRHKPAALRWNYSGTTLTVQTSTITTDLTDANPETYQMKGDISGTGIMHIAFRDHYDSGLDYFKLVQDGDVFTVSDSVQDVGDDIMAYETENVSVDVQLVAPNKFLISWGPQSHNDFRTFVRQYPATDLTLENFIGFSSAAYTNGQTAKINVVGNTTTQSSLTPGQKYYIQNNGSLGLIPDDPSVVGGRALTATNLLITHA